MNWVKVIFLGTGAVAPARRELPAILVSYEGTNVLLDASEGVQSRINKVLSPARIDVVGITHMHGDHVLGLIPLLESMSMGGRSKPLYLIGPSNLGEYLLCNFKNLYFKPNFEINIVNELTLNKIHVRKFPVCHGVESYGIVIEIEAKPKLDVKKLEELGIPPSPLWGAIQRGERVVWKGAILEPDAFRRKRKVKIVYTGDTAPCKSVIENSKGADLLIHEATFTKDVDGVHELGHSYAEDAAKIAKEANVKRLVLFHISSRYKDAKKHLLEAKRIFKNTVVAEDFITLVLPI